MTSEIISFFISEELKARDERIQRIQNENRHFLESLAILLSTPSRFVESLEVTIKDRIRDITTEIKEKTTVNFYSFCNSFSLFLLREFLANIIDYRKENLKCSNSVQENYQAIQPTEIMDS